MKMEMERYKMLLIKSCQIGRDSKTYNTECRAQSAEQRVQSTECRAQSAEHRVQSTECGLQIAECRVQSA